MSKPRIAVVLRHGLNATHWGERHARGEVVDRTPYAYHLAEEDFELEWSRDAIEGAPSRWWRATLRRVLGFDLVHVWRNRAMIARADAVWTHTEREHLAVAMLKLLAPRTYRAHSIAQSVWLWDQWPGMAGVRRRLFAALLRRHSLEIVLSRLNRDASRAAAPGRTVARVPFGTHFAVAPAADAAARRAPRVLVVGNDRHRDWNLIARVAANLPDVAFDIVSLSENARAIDWPRNVDVRDARQTELLAHLYAQATVVALPLRPNLHASGCTVAIEGISAGLPVVATDAGGIDEYLEGSAGGIAAVGDEAAFTELIRRHAHRTELADTSLAARRGLSERDYIARLVSVTRSVLDGRPIDETALSFAPLPTTAAARGAA